MATPSPLGDRRRERRPGIVDVGKVAGVSYQTVSRVLNHKPGVRPATRQRVLDAMEQLGYRRNLSARTLKTNRSTTIGIVTDTSPRFGPVSTLIALENAIRDAAYNVRVATVEEPFDRSVPAAIASMEELGADGIIIITPRFPMAEAVRNADLHVAAEMIAAGAPSSPGLFTHYEDQEVGARMATRHLLDLGHTRIAHLAGSMEWFDGRIRRKGWEGEMRDAGLEPGACYVGDWSPGWAYETGLRLIDQGLPHAIFAASDHTALGLFRAFAEHGISVPRDISVVGFDDIEGADYFHPPLTTVRQDFRGLAHRSVALLLRAIDGREFDPRPITPVLKVRASTASRQSV